MLSKSQVRTTIEREREGRFHTMMELHERAGSFFSLLPPEVIEQIGKFDRDISIALHHAAYAQQKNVDALIAMLEEKPRLLLEAGNVVTPGGLEVKGVTIYEFLLGAGDPDLAKKVAPYFEKILNGENERQHQYERYKPYIEAMLEQKPDHDLTSLFEVIKNASADDVAAELATGDKYDKNYQSKLRDALNSFRATKLDPKVRIMRKPRMHCNYQNLIHAYAMIKSEWNNLYRASGNNDDKIHLVARQIIGLMQLVELPGYDRCLFARGQLNKAAKGKEIERSSKYKYSSGSFFPDFDLSLMDSHSGVGFDSYISPCGQQVTFAGSATISGRSLHILCRTKLQTYRTYAATHERKLLGA